MKVHPDEFAMAREYSSTHEFEHLNPLQIHQVMVRGRELHKWFRAHARLHAAISLLAIGSIFVVDWLVWIALVRWFVAAVPGKWALILAAIFTAWYRSEGTLSIHSINTPRREKFYWATVLATFALGTAGGDLTATEWHLGFLPSGLMFIALIAVPAIAWRRFGLNSVIAFWFAYIVTRPLGASFADYFSKPHALSGLNFGDGPTTAVFVVVIIALVGYLQLSKRDAQPVTDEAERVWPRTPSPTA